MPRPHWFWGVFLIEYTIMKRVFLIHGWEGSPEYDGYENELVSFFQTPVDWENIKKHCAKFAAIHSTDDPYVSIKHNTLFQEKLGAKSIVEQGRGHYNDKEYPVILSALLDIIS